MQGSSEKRQRVKDEERQGVRIRPAYVILAIIMALFAVKFVQKMQEVRHLQAQEAALQQQNDQIRRDNSRVQGAIRWERSPDYIESEARASFGYTRPGDVPVIVRPHPAPIVTMRAAPPRPPAPPQPPWKQWWNSFFGG